MEKFEGTIGDHIKHNTHTKSGRTAGCMEFSTNIFGVFKAEGTICKDGVLTLKAKFLDMTVTDLTINILNAEYCNKLNIGFEEIEYCFYIKDSCLWTKGYIDGVLHKKQNWDEKIVCV